MFFVWSGVCHVLGISTSQTSSESFSPCKSCRFQLGFSTASGLAAGLCSVQKEDTGFSVSEAVCRAALTIPGQLLDSPELPSSQFLSKMEKVITGFSVPPPHHVQYSTASELPASLMNSQFVFVHEDASEHSLAALYIVPCGTVEQIFPPADWIKDRLSISRPPETSNSS